MGVPSHETKVDVKDFEKGVKKSGKAGEGLKVSRTRAAKSAFEVRSGEDQYDILILIKRRFYKH